MSASVLRRAWTLTSPAAPGSVVVGTVSGLGRFFAVTLTWTALGATGGTTSVFAQYLDGAGNWVDLARFGDVAAGAGATTYSISVNKRPSATASVTVGTGTTPVIAANTVASQDFGDTIRIIAVANASTTAGALQTIGVLASRGAG